MIDYYRLPALKAKITNKDLLKVIDESELKDAIYNRSIEKVKAISFKNSNIKDDTLKLLKGISTPLMVQTLDLSQNFSFVTDASVQTLC